MNAKSTTKKQCGKKSAQELPTYQKRRTVDDHVKDNMLCAGKQNYHQRIIFVAQHVPMDKKELIDIRKFVHKLVTTTNQHATSDKLTGLMLFYNMYSIYLIEGGEDNIGNFMKSLRANVNDIFDVNRVLVIYNNSNRRFFEKMFNIYAKPEVKLSLDNPQEHEIILQEILNRVTTICLTIINDPSIIDEKSHINLLDKKLLPDTGMIDDILKISSLQTVEEFADIYGCVPEFFDYKTHVWPHPYDFLPDNVFDWGKFDVNLTIDSK